MPEQTVKTVKQLAGEAEETTMVSKSLLKRLYNELKRLKSIEKQNDNIHNQYEANLENQQYTREMVGEPLYQMTDELNRRGFRERSLFAQNFDQNDNGEINLIRRRKRNI